jgi:hypothetical protein
MLTQLSRLSTEADGRYATAEELQFLKDYLMTTEKRVQVYQKVRDQEALLIQELQDQVRLAGGNLYKGSQDVSSLFRRDQKHILRTVSAATLFNDLDFLREGLLLWHRTIVRAFCVQQPAQIACQIWPHVLLKYLSSDEYQLASPAIGLVSAILG